MAGFDEIKLGEIPTFSEVAFQIISEPDFARLTEELQAGFQARTSPGDMSRLLLSLQDQMRERQSQVAYTRIKTALTGEPSVTSDQQETDLLIPLRKAKSSLYEAIAQFPPETLDQSDEDRDLRFRSWRWQHFERQVPQLLQAEERRLKRALRELQPRLYPLRQKYFLGADMAWDHKQAAPMRQAFLRDLKAHLRADADQKSELFSALFNNRRKIAQACGYANFSDYHEARRGKRSFSRREEADFLETYIRYFTPLGEELARLRDQRFAARLREPDQYFLISPQGQLPLAVAASKAGDLFQQSLGKLTDHPDHYLIRLLQQGYVSYRGEVAELLGPCTLLEAIPAAFLALSLDDRFASVPQAFYDTGVALAAISTMLNYHTLGASRQDAFSMACSGYVFQALSLPVLGNFYENHAEIAYDEAWYRSLLLSFLRIAIYRLENEMSHQDNEIHWQDVSGIWREVLTTSLPFVDFSHTSDEDFRLMGHFLLSYHLESYQSLASVLALVTILAEQPRRASSRRIMGKLNNYLLYNPGSSIYERLKAADFHDPCKTDVVERAAFSLSDILEL